MALRKNAEDPDVVRITSAPHNPGDDISRRQRRYLISMTIRTLCFVGAVLAFRVPWLCFTLIAASFVLPFIAVVVANSASPRISGTLEGPGVAPPSPFGELGPGPDRNPPNR